MNDCRFCNGKPMSAEMVGEGIKTMGMMIDMMFGRSKKEKDYLENGIQLQDGKYLTFDNSAGEYAAQAVEISYCPFCGRKLTNDKDAG